MSHSLKIMLDKNKMSLIVSLPENNSALAHSALQAGADALKMHVNVSHWASGNQFHSTETYQDQFLAIKENFSGPLGIVPGGSLEAIQKSELEKLSALGFTYYSIYGHHLPAWMLELDTFEKTFAINGEYTVGKVKKFGITAIEASIIQSSEYGSPLTFKDIMAYSTIVEKTDVPIIVPSQRLLLPEDIPAFYKAGVKAVMLGAVTIGKSEGSMEKAVSAFRNAIDRL